MLGEYGKLLQSSIDYQNVETLHCYVLRHEIMWKILETVPSSRLGMLVKVSSKG